MTKNTKNGTERDDHSETKNRTERDGTEQDGIEREWNDWKKGTRTERSAEGPRSRTVQNDFKKVGTCPALVGTCPALVGTCPALVGTCPALGRD